MIHQRDEHKLIRQAQRGRQEALEELLDIYESKVYNLARRMVDPRDAEDVAQEALIEVCNSIGSFAGRSGFSTWVYRVAVNVCLQHRRKRAPEVTPIEDDLSERCIDPDGDPAAVAVRNALKSEVDCAIQALPEIHRDVVVLHELQGLTYAECAQVLGCPVGTVKSRLSHAFGKLRELLKEHASESEAEI